MFGKILDWLKSAARPRNTGGTQTADPLIAAAPYGL